MNTFYVYIIYSANTDILYKGYTTDPDARLRSHNDNLNRYTKFKGPWKMVYLRAFHNKSLALKEEKRLKRQHRPYLEWFIQNDPHNIL